MQKKINGRDFRKMMMHAAAAIAAEQQRINDLNVFPVPDGDTGTNMSMTVRAAAHDLSCHDTPEVGEAAAIAASAMLRGARGNSGVILSLIFRGFSKALKGKTACTGAELATALKEGVNNAYSAVMKPTEGTILTVSRLAAQKAAEVAAKSNEPETVLSEALAAAELALQDTVEQNPVLKKAGVVDAGGMGFVVILRGMLAAYRGEPMPELSDTAEDNAENAFSAVGDSEITYTFDTVFIVRKESGADWKAFRAYLSSVGDSLVIGEDDENYKVHIHTDTPGNVLSEAQKYGTLQLAKIENMRTQYEEAAQGGKPQSTDDLSDDFSGDGKKETPVATPEKPFGFLAVCAGDGLSAMFRDLGADAVVSGGQTMNPSTESIVNAVNTVPAETVFVLPNNKNIIMAAQQCDALTEKKVIVIPSASVPQGIASMLAVTPALKSAEAIESAMNDAMKGVTTAQITYAARNSEFDGISINEGDYLALLDGKLLATSRSVSELAKKIAMIAGEKETEFLSVFYGADVREEDAAAMGELFSEKVPGAEVSVLFGGQPVYYYIISME